MTSENRQKLIAFGIATTILTVLFALVGASQVLQLVGAVTVSLFLLKIISPEGTTP